MIITAWKEINKPLLLPPEAIEKLGGNRSRRIFVIITKSDEIIMTRSPQDYEVSYQVKIGKNDDFIPTAILKKAGMKEVEEFKIYSQDDDLKIVGIKREYDGPAIETRNLDI